MIIIGIFGLCVRNEQTELSGIDILIELQRPIGLKFYELWDYLEKLLICEVEGKPIERRNKL